MTPEQALNVVAQAAQAASLPYQSHLQVQEALKVIFEKLKEKESEKD